MVELDGHRFKLTNLGKVLYPDTGTTKAEVIGYFAEVAPVMVPLLAGRPCTRKRWPDGVRSQPFFQKNTDASTPTWVRQESIEHTSGTNHYPVVDHASTLAWLAQNAALELHVPQWRFDDAGTPRHPDRLVFDLDPGPGVGLAECAEVARRVRDRLWSSGVRLPVVPVTSGSKGLHLYLALDGTLTSQQASEWARAMAEAVEGDLPDLVVSRMTKALRTGKVFIDWSQNNGNKTTIAPYSLRGRETPTAAAPRDWDELDDPELRHLDMHEVLARLRESGGADPMAQLSAEQAPARRSSSGSRTRVSAAAAAAATAEQDKLAAYRAKRSADRTPEPVPAAAALPVGGNDTFVIQEHHATRLHYDVRLERGGVLVSWAVPKNLPTDQGQNRLAVHTEDHPLEYATFSGTIPKGEYGGGRMSIWDSGHYVTDKWRDDEVIVWFDGARTKGRYAFIRTGGDNWLAHLMADQTPPKTGASPAASSPEPARRATRRARTEPDAAALEPPPTGIEPMAASAGSVAALAKDADWRFEGKWDGIRAIARVGPDVFELRSRTGRDITAGYPELAELAELLDGHSVVLDGEIVAYATAAGPSGDGAGRTDFGLLQQRMNLVRPAEVRTMVDAVPVTYLAFDVLYVDGISLLHRGYDTRRQLLQALPLHGDRVRVPEALTGTVQEALDATDELGWEGVVAKRATSVYQPGKRSGSWIKLKHQRTQEVVLVGWKPGNGRRAGTIGSLLLAVPADDGRLRYAGKVGTGFTDAILDDLFRRLDELRTPTSAVVGTVPRAEARGAVWVEPELVGEIVFTEWTHDDHVRAASWRGLRPDKRPQDVRLE
ncbi:ATP-dependent DNA ligase [Nakamurella leprariae]|uniref:DNA ligase (ATP) n=1 Tax=Nakamurella leprariae TaxID=2803911 RepID=A0A939C0B2_9ACTN|nr:ATP-dependent DNA ligase [Nakamurella leprariae]